MSSFQLYLYVCVGVHRRSRASHFLATTTKAVGPPICWNRKGPKWFSELWSLYFQKYDYAPLDNRKRKTRKKEFNFHFAEIEWRCNCKKTWTEFDWNAWHLKWKMVPLVAIWFLPIPVVSSLLPNNCGNAHLLPTKMTKAHLVDQRQITKHCFRTV